MHVRARLVRMSIIDDVLAALRLVWYSRRHQRQRYTRLQRLLDFDALDSSSLARPTNDAAPVPGKQPLVRCPCHYCCAVATGYNANYTRTLA